jgi:hypothetical protein
MAPINMECMKPIYDEYTYLNVLYGQIKEYNTLIIHNKNKLKVLRDNMIMMKEEYENLYDKFTATFNNGNLYGMLCVYLEETEAKYKISEEQYLTEKMNCEKLVRDYNIVLLNYNKLNEQYKQKNQIFI